MTVPEADIDAGLQQARVRLHRTVLPTSAAASAGVALALAVVMWPRAPQHALLLWLAALAVVLGLRLGIGHAQTLAQAKAPLHAERWLRRHRAAFLLHGLVWAAVYAVALPGLAQDQLDLILFALTAIAAGGLIAAAFDLPAAMLFATPPLLALAAATLWRGNGQGLGLGLMVLLFLGGTGLSALRSQRSAREGVQLQLAEAARMREAQLSAEQAEQARQQLANQHHLLTQLMQTTQQGFWFLDNEGRTTQLNPAMALMLGLRREEVLGRSVFDFFHGADLDLVKVEFEARRQGRPGGYEIGLQRADGSRLHCVNHATPIYDTQGRKVGSVGLWTDISVRRQAETRLRTYELVVNSITDMVSVTDDREVYRMVNDAWCRATGVPRDQALGRRSVDALPGGVSPERHRALQEALHSGQTRSVRGDSGTPTLAGRLLETTYYPYAESAAGERCVAMVTRDVTEQSRTLQMLQANEAEQRALLEAFPGFIGRFDAELVYTYANQRLADLLGLSPEQVVGRTAAQVLGPQRAAEVLPLAQRALAGEQVVYEYRQPGRDGQAATDVEATLAPGVDPRSGAPMIFGFAIDITARKQAERALRESEAELRSLLAAFPGYIAAADQQPMYTYVNDRLAAVMGLPAQQMVGRHVLDVLGPERHAVVAEDLRRARAGEHVVNERTYTVGPQHQRLDMEVTHVAGPPQAGGRRTSYAFGIDITSRKQAQEALIAARDEAERANRAKSQFLAQMSHELRTPLNAILGFGQLLQSDPQQALVGRQPGHVREILRGAKHLLALINEILDLGRIEAGNLRLETTPVPLAPLVDECLALMQALALEHGVQLQPPQLAGADLGVRADRTRLKQVLLNLLANAIKYNCRGGSVGVRCGVQAATVRLAVQDSGRGLTADEQARLFQPFERLGAAQSGIEGTGIGLALSRRLVESMGGQIGVESQPGSGSVFWVALPDAGASASPPDKPPALPVLEPAVAPLVERTVLYIEDNAVNVVLMEAMLMRLPGLRLLSAELPEPGLLLAQQELPALVLLDIQLPGIDGFEVLARLRAAPATRAIPVVAVSANAVPADIDAAMAAGFDAYLTKPLELQVLLSTVQSFLKAQEAESGS